MKHFTVSCHSYESVELIIQEEQPGLQLRKSDRLFILLRIFEGMCEVHPSRSIAESTSVPVRPVDTFNSNVSWKSLFHLAGLVN